MERRKVYYKGEGGGFPQVRAMVCLVSSSCPWLVLAPKVLWLCTNHFVLVLCRFVWIIEACQFFLVPSRSSSMPLYPSIVMRTRERALTPYSSVVFSLGLTFEFLKELGVRQMMFDNYKNIDGDEKISWRTIRRVFYNWNIEIYWMLDIGGQLCIEMCMITINLVMHVKEQKH